MEKVKVTVPDYYINFHCIGPECPCSCCFNWGEISIDKETYKKYKNFPNPDFNKKVQTALKPITKPDGSIEAHRAAVVVLNERGECPFLTENGLCEIHQRMGIAYLSNTCKKYPRSTIRNVKPHLEASLTLSCWEVARLALSPSNRQQFAKIEMDAKHVEANKSPAVYGGVLKDYVRDIRQNCMEMMQNEELPILQRIFSIAHFLQGIENSLNKTEDGGGKIDLSMSAEQVTDAIRTKVTSFNDFMLVIKEVIEKKYGEGTSTKINDKDIHRYIILESQMEWDNVIKSKALMFENYFVNFIFQKVFPFGHNQLNMFSHAYLLWERYELCRFFLGAFIIKNGKIEDNDIVKVVSRIEKHFSHEKAQTTVDRILKVYLK